MFEIKHSPLHIHHCPAPAAVGQQGYHILAFLSMLWFQSPYLTQWAPQGTANEKRPIRCPMAADVFCSACVLYSEAGVAVIDVALCLTSSFKSYEAGLLSGVNHHGDLLSINLLQITDQNLSTTNQMTGKPESSSYRILTGTKEVGL